jgi:hypothetical protein
VQRSSITPNEKHTGDKEEAFQYSVIKKLETKLPNYNNSTKLKWSLAQSLFEKYS